MLDFQYPALFTPSEDPSGKTGGFLVQFPDIPEALTEGTGIADAIDQARDALGLALRAYLDEGWSLPTASPSGSVKLAKGERLISVTPHLPETLKLAVAVAFAEAGISKSELARRMGRAETEARRILDPRHRTGVGLLEEAMQALECQVDIRVRKLEMV